MAQMSAIAGENNGDYHALPRPGGFRMDNKDHHVSAEFTATGVSFRQENQR
jgi:hypothetical protein